MQNYLPKEIRQENRKKQNDFQEEITTQNKEWVKERRLEFLSKELKENECQILAVNNAISKNCPKWFQEYAFDENIKPLLKKNRKMNYEMKIWNTKDYVNLSEIDEDDIEEAKSVPIQDFVEVKRTACDRAWTNCPIGGHVDKTPSFCIFLDTNTFKCFSCQAYGDSINFIQEFYKLNFIEAVKFLIHK